MFHYLTPTSPQVQDNIEGFGGDKTKVTIFGESAGAASVGYLMLLPEAAGERLLVPLQGGLWLRFLFFFHLLILFCSFLSGNDGNSDDYIVNTGHLLIA